MNGPQRLRWALVGVLVLSSSLNYLDRLVLAALAPTIKFEYGLTAQDYGYVLAAFSIVYAFGSPVIGLAIDRMGLRLGTTLIVVFWSLAGMATAFVSSFTGLLFCRAALGLAEAGGVPATGKAFATYLEPRDRAVGTALNQVGLTLGSSAAPLLAAWCLARGNWRAAFVVAGALGLLWVPAWLWTIRKAPPLPVRDDGQEKVTAGAILRDRRFAWLVLANILCMTVYSLWTNWTTVFLVSRFALTPSAANQWFAWIPPIFATAGGLFGGWLARRLIQSGTALPRARFLASLAGAVLAAGSAAAPAASTPAVATALVSLGLFAVTSMSVNYYAVPLDLFGPARAAFAVSALTGSFGLMQAFLSPAIGAWSDAVGWGPVCAAVAITPLLSIAVLRLALRNG